MHKFLLTLTLGLLLLIPTAAQAAGIDASGGGSKTIGQQFTVTVTASGTTFDSLQGTINVSGPVSIVSFSAGGATWLPGKSPTNGGQFVGITSATSSLTVAKITLKGTKEGSGSVSLSGVKLARNGSLVGSDSGSTNFTIGRAPTPPGSINVTSSSHPDQGQAYEATTIELSWPKDKGVTGFSYLLDQSATTTPATKVTSADTSTKYENKAVGTWYFHIRGQNSDGWGATTHFKITIKEPDPRIDQSLAKPQVTNVKKLDTFTTNLSDGTATGFIVSGTNTPGMKTVLTFTPGLSLPTEKSLTVDTNEAGTWEFIIDFPIKAGFYKITAQGQKDKILSPVSDEAHLEVSLAKGGSLVFLSDSDAVSAATPTPEATASPTPHRWWPFNGDKAALPKTIIGLSLLGVAGIGTHHISKKRRH